MILKDFWVFSSQYDCTLFLGLDIRSLYETTKPRLKNDQAWIVMTSEDPTQTIQPIIDTAGIDFQYKGHTFYLLTNVVNASFSRNISSIDTCQF